MTFYPHQVARGMYLILMPLICIGLLLFSPRQASADEVLKTLTGNTYALQQDKKGFLWIGTEYGVLRYDGHALVRAGELDPAASWLDHVPVRNLVLDPRGHIWIVSDKGVAVYEGADRGFRKVDGITDLDIVAFHPQGADQFWIGAKQGLYLFDVTQNTLERYGSWGRSQVAPITSLFRDSNARLWIGTSAGLFLLNTTTKEIVWPGTRDENKPQFNTSFVTEDVNGTLWVGTIGDGLIKVTADGKSSEKERFHIERIAGFPAKNLTAYAGDSRGYLTVGTENNGVLIWDPVAEKNVVPNWQRQGASDVSLYNGQAVIAVFVDKTNMLWVGTPQGLFKIPPKSDLLLDIVGADIFEKLGLAEVKTLARDADGNLWIGTFGNGVLRVDLLNGSTRWFVNDPDNENSLVDDRIISIEVDKSNHVWIATHAGVSRYDIHNEVFNTYLGNQERNHIVFQDVFISRKNDILIATQNEGVLHYNALTDQFERWAATVGPEESRQFYNVHHLVEDHNGTYWLAAGLDGLVRIDEDESVIRRIKGEPSVSQVLRGHNVRSVATGGDGNIWAGTRGGGVFGISSDGTEFKQFKRVDGLPANEVSCLLEDGEGFVWVASRHGLARIDPESDQVVRFDKHDGIAFSQVHYNACLFNGSVLYIGSGNGVRLFDTGKKSIDEPGPPVELVDVKVWDKPFPFTNQSEIVSFNHDQNYLRFKFMIPDFLNPRENKLQYMLAGSGESWKAADPGNIVSLDKLKPGTYHVQVRGANHRGIWGEPSVYSFNIASFSWIGPRTSGALLVGFFLVLGLILGLHLRYRRQLQALKEEYSVLKHQSDQSAENIRSQIARDLHDDLGADLSRLVLSLENRLQRDDLSDFSLAWTRECWDYAQRITREVRHLSWAVDPERNWLPDLVDRIYREAHETIEMDKVEFSISHIPRVFLPPSIRKDIFLIFREALTNITNHASAEEIRIYVNYKEHLFELIVEDNGIGFDPQDIKEGNGLKNMRRRAQNLNARLTWEDLSQAGTRVILEVPLD